MAREAQNEAEGRMNWVASSNQHKLVKVETHKDADGRMSLEARSTQPKLLREEAQNEAVERMNSTARSSQPKLGIRKKGMGREGDRHDIDHINHKVSIGIQQYRL